MGMIDRSSAIEDGVFRIHRGKGTEPEAFPGMPGDHTFGRAEDFAADLERVRRGQAAGKSCGAGDAGKGG